MTYFSSNEVSGLGGDFAFSEVSKPLDVGDNEGVETCKMPMWNCNVTITVKSQFITQNTSQE